MSYFPNVIAVGLADADICPSQEIIAMLVLSCSLVRRRDDMSVPWSTPFFLFFGISIYICVQVKRGLCRGGICLWRGQGDGEMTTEMVMSLWYLRNGWKCLPCRCLPEYWKSSRCCHFPDYSITNSIQMQQILDWPFASHSMSSWSHIVNIHYSCGMETNSKWKKMHRASLQN